jgi:c-di-GMP-binding flagellar brake protein YcgR
MQDDSEIIVGEKVELVQGNDRFYKTMIEDIYEGGVHLVGVPSVGGVPILLYVDDEVDIIFHRKSGKYAATMKVIAFEKRGEIRYVLLQQKAQAHKDQRRGAYRLPVRMKVLICEQTNGTETAPAGTAPAEPAPAAKPPIDKPPAGNEAKISLIYKAAREAASQRAAAGKPAAAVVAGPTTIEAVGSKDVSVTGIGLLSKREYETGKTFLLKLHLRDPMDKSPLSIRAVVTRTFPTHDKGIYHVGLQFTDLTRDEEEIITKYVHELQQKQLKQRRLADRGWSS